MFIRFFNRFSNCTDWYFCFLFYFSINFFFFGGGVKKTDSDLNSTEKRSDLFIFTVFPVKQAMLLKRSGCYKEWTVGSNKGRQVHIRQNKIITKIVLLHDNVASFDINMAISRYIY